MGSSCSATSSAREEVSVDNTQFLAMMSNDDARERFKRPTPSSSETNTPTDDACISTAFWDGECFVVPESEPYMSIDGASNGFTDTAPSIDVVAPTPPVDSIGLPPRPPPRATLPAHQNSHECRPPSPTTPSSKDRDSSPVVSGPATMCQEIPDSYPAPKIDIELDSSQSKKSDEIPSSTTNPLQHPLHVAIDDEGPSASMSLGVGEALSHSSIPSGLRSIHALAMSSATESSDTNDTNSLLSTTHCVPFRQQSAPIGSTFRATNVSRSRSASTFSAAGEKTTTTTNNLQVAAARNLDDFSLSSSFDEL